jgi:hypothetical protein
MMNSEEQGLCKKVAVAYCSVGLISKHFPGGTEGNHKIRQSDQESKLGSLENEARMPLDTRILVFMASRISLIRTTLHFNGLGL